MFFTNDLITQVQDISLTDYLACKDRYAKDGTLLHLSNIRTDSMFYRKEIVENRSVPSPHFGSLPS